MRKRPLYGERVSSHSPRIGQASLGDGLDAHVGSGGGGLVEARCLSLSHFLIWHQRETIRGLNFCTDGGDYDDEG